MEVFKTYLALPVNPGEPQHHHAYWRLGMVYEHLGEKALAVESYRAALALDPKNEEAKKALRKLE